MRKSKYHYNLGKEPLQTLQILLNAVPGTELVLKKRWRGWMRKSGKEAL